MNNTETLLLIAIIPILLILFYVYKKDRNKEPFLLLLTFFVLGILSVYIVIGISFLLYRAFPFIALDKNHISFLNVLLYTFFGVGLIEEFGKWIMVYTLGYNHKEYDEFYDMIIYAVFVSLGFAFFENIVYVLDSGKASTAIIRAIFAIPAHACNGVFMGYHLSLSKYYEQNMKPKLKRIEMRKSIWLPAVLHGIYDFCLLSGRFEFLYVFLFFTTGLMIISIIKINQVSKYKKKITN